MTDDWKKDETTVADELELRRSLTQVDEKIDKFLTTDFTLAKLTENQRKTIVELISDAYHVRRMIRNIIIKSKNKVPYYNKEKGKWYWRDLNDEEKERINAKSLEAFESIMTKVRATVIMHRNMPQNYLIEQILRTSDIGQELAEEEAELQKTKLKKAKEKLLKNSER